MMDSSKKIFVALLSVIELGLVSVLGGDDLLLVLGGAQTPGVSLINQICDKKCEVSIPDVPQPYGSPGRRGSYAVRFHDSVIVCGGMDFSGPPFSSFKDCQRLDLSSLSWSEVPGSMANYSALGASAKISSREYLVFGGLHARNFGGPTDWVEHDTIQKLTLTDELELEWTELESRTYEKSPMLESCAVSLEDGNVVVVTETQILHFNPQSQQWTALKLGLKLSNSLGPYSCAKTNIDDQTFIVVMNLDSPFAFNPESQSIIMLPKPRGSRDKPIVTVVDNNIILHGQSEDSFEESLGNDDNDDGNASNKVDVCQT